MSGTDVIDSVNTSEIPVFTAWQAMPITFIALAWVDTEFKEQLLIAPNSFIRRVMDDCPNNLAFCALENTESLRHLVIPYRHPSTFHWTRDEVEKQLRKEILSNNNLAYGLPVHVISEAFFDPNFKYALTVEPRETLMARGIDVEEYDYFVHENTEHTSHLIIPENSWGDQELDYDQLEERLSQELQYRMMH